MEEKNLNAIYTWKKTFAVVYSDEKNKHGGNYDVFIQENEIVFKTIKSFLPTYQANKSGLIGLLLNKSFSKALKKSYFSFPFKEVKKIEHAISKDPYGREINNFMFWNIENGNYENITFSLSPKPNEVSIVEEMIKKVLPETKFEVKTL